MTDWKPWTPEEVIEWVRKCNEGTLFNDAPAQAAYVAKPRLPIKVEGIEHGTARGYVDGCTCGPCTNAYKALAAFYGMSS